MIDMRLRMGMLSRDFVLSLMRMRGLAGLFRAVPRAVLLRSSRCVVLPPYVLLAYLVLPLLSWFLEKSP